MFTHKMVIIVVFTEYVQYALSHANSFQLRGKDMN